MIGVTDGSYTVSVPVQCLADAPVLAREHELHPTRSVLEVGYKVGETTLLFLENYLRASADAKLQSVINCFSQEEFAWAFWRILEFFDYLCIVEGEKVILRAMCIDRNLFEAAALTQVLLQRMPPPAYLRDVVLDLVKQRTIDFQQARIVLRTFPHVYKGRDVYLEWLANIEFVSFDNPGARARAFIRAMNNPATPDCIFQFIVDLPGDCELNMVSLAIEGCNPAAIRAAATKINSSVNPIDVHITNTLWRKAVPAKKWKYVVDAILSFGCARDGVARLRMTTGDIADLALNVGNLSSNPVNDVERLLAYFCKGLYADDKNTIRGQAALAFIHCDRGDVISSLLKNRVICTNNETFRKYVPRESERKRYMQMYRLGSSRQGVDD